MSGLGPLRLGSGRTAPPTLFRVYLLLGAVILALSLLLYFNSLARRVDSQAEAMSSLLAEVIGFSTLLFSGFKINADMGLLTAMAIAIALLVDFLMLPTLLIWLDHRHQPQAANAVRVAVEQA